MRGEEVKRKAVKRLLCVMLAAFLLFSSVSPMQKPQAEAVISLGITAVVSLIGIAAGMVFANVGDLQSASIGISDSRSIGSYWDQFTRGLSVVGGEFGQ
jgi:hypothetical protein